jgi:ribose transport system permease protein
VGNVKKFLPNIRLPKTGAVYGILIMLIGFSIWSPGYLTVTNVFNMSRQMAPLAIIAICSFLAILTGNIDLSVGGIMGFSGIMACVLNNGGMNIWLACIIAVVLSMFFGFINGILIGYTSIEPFIITLATMGMSQSLAQVIGGGTLRFSTESFGLLSSMDIFGVIPLPMLIIAILYLVFIFILYKRPLGVRLYAIGGREEAALAAGINIRTLKILVFTINGLLAGIAGLMLCSRMNAANPSFGIGYELQGVCSAVLGGTVIGGGVGTVGGVFLGSLAIHLLRNGMNIVGVNSSIQMIAVGAILIVILTVDVLRKGGANR